MYKIRKLPSCNEPLPVATVPSVLRNKFQFFVGEDQLRYFNYVERYRQRGDVLKRVAVVIQDQVIIADLEGNAKRCININKIKTIYVDVHKGYVKFLLSIPDEYDVLLRVIRSGMSLLKAILFTARSMDSCVDILTKCLNNSKDMSLKCPEGHIKKRTFQLTPKSGFSSPTSIPSTAGNWGNYEPYHDVCEKDNTKSPPAKSVTFSDSNLNHDDINSFMNIPPPPIISIEANTSVILDGCSMILSEGSISADDDVAIANHRTAVNHIRCRSVHAYSILATEDASVASALAVVLGSICFNKRLSTFDCTHRTSTFDFPTQRRSCFLDSPLDSELSFGSPTSTVWTADDCVQIFHRQDDGYMKWVDCSVINTIGDTFAIKLHVTFCNPEAAILMVKRHQLRRSWEHDEECLPECWCSQEK